MGASNVILFFGNSDQRMDEIKEELCRKYYLRYCPILLGCKPELETGVCPGVILAYLENLSLTDYVVLNKLVRDSLRSTPVIIMGTAQECDVFRSHVDSVKPIQLLLPVTNNDVMQAVRLCLGSAPVTANEIKHILLVDDDRLMLRTIRSFLNGEYRVSAVASGRDALHFLKKNVPDLILLD